MKSIAIIGTGYVGLVTGACFADAGLDVVCVDTNPSLIAGLTQGTMPFFEPELEELVRRNFEARRLRFTTDATEAVGAASVIFLTVGTPEAAGGDADLSYLMRAAESVAQSMDTYRVLVVKSTVPPGTVRRVSERVNATLADGVTCDVVSNPEFLSQGSAVRNFREPDRVVIGADSDAAAIAVKELYETLHASRREILVTGIETAELIKCAANAYLAVRISFINEIANLCDQVGADVRGVIEGIGLDARIGRLFLDPGPGYGGSCFPKDTKALCALGGSHAVQGITKAAVAANSRQLELTAARVKKAVAHQAAPCVAVLGLAFKANTSDVRESPAIFLCRALLDAGMAVRAFDPAAAVEAQQLLGDGGGRMVYCESAYDAADGATAVVVMTDWNEFKGLDLQRVRGLVAEPILVDTRNMLEPTLAAKLGFQYVCTGRQVLVAGDFDVESIPI